MGPVSGAISDCHGLPVMKLRKKAKANTAETETGDPVPELLTEVVELQPEHEALQEELTRIRNGLLEKATGRAVKSILVELVAVVAKIAKDEDPEKVLAKEGVLSLRRFISAQGLCL